MSITDIRLQDLYQKDILKYLGFKNFETNDSKFLHKIINEVIAIKHKELTKKHLIKSKTKQC